MDWEAKFRAWAKPPGKSEQDRCDNAISAIRNAIKSSSDLRDRSILVFPQGSYRNNTNVRNDSDVDVGVLCTDTFFYRLPEGYAADMFNIIPATYDYAQYKNHIEAALTSYFSRGTVTRGNKAFDIHETSYHVDADVAPFFQHRRYSPNGSYIEGVQLCTDKQQPIINWPEQHYQNGVQKNKDTGTRFKSIVRVLKALSNEMAGANISAGNVPGFLIECLVWNVPNNLFQNSTYTEDVKSALVFLYQNTTTDDLCKEWGEVCDLKYLFQSLQKWRRSQANDFISAAWSYAKLGD
ncbi:MAG: nucleotidyltransferase [Smithella sp.]